MKSQIYSHPKTIISGLLLAATLAACGAPANQSYDTQAGLAPAAMPAAPAAAEMSKAGAPAMDQATKPNGPAPAAPGAPRMIIRNANLTLIVADVPGALASISQVARDYNGYIVSSNSSISDRMTRANVNLRVDSARLDDALARLRALAIEVRNENISGDDVSAEFSDLGAQLANLESAAAQLQKIMDQAAKTEDVLNVFKTLTEMRGQIDQIKGRMKFLSQSAALSSISLELIPDAAAKPVEPPVWRPLGTINKAIEALLRSTRTLIDGALYFGIAVLPILLVVIGLPLLLIMAAGRALRNRKPKAAPATPAAPVAPVAPTANKPDAQ